MSDIAEIPVDEQERPLPPPPRPVRSALMDGPILRTLLGLAWPNVVSGGNATAAKTIAAPQKTTRLLNLNMREIVCGEEGREA